MVCGHDERNIKVCKIVSKYSGTKLKSSLPNIKFGQHSARGVPLFNPNLMCEEFRKCDESAGVERLMQFNQENHGVKKAVFEIMASEMKSSGKMVLTRSKTPTPEGTIIQKEQEVIYSTEYGTYLRGSGPGGPRGVSRASHSCYGDRKFQTHLCHARATPPIATRVEECAALAMSVN